MLAAAILAPSGPSIEAAFEKIAKARGCAVPDTPEQRDYVRRVWKHPVDLKPFQI